jgi:transcriptional regulator with XRE-family HTH domain
MNVAERIAPTDPLALRSLVRSWRARIHAEARYLGTSPREASRIGKAVTQEEVAAVAGISVRWYAALESLAALRTSPVVLGRIAEALMLADDERRQLFTLAIPEITGSSFRSPLTRMSATGPLRSVVRRLCEATSQSDVMTAIAERAAEHFTNADFVGVFRRSDPGQWDFPVMVGDARSYAQLSCIHAELYERLNPLEIDEAMLQGALLEPGDVGTRRELHRDLTVKPHIDRAFAANGFADADFLVAHIRSNSGLTANLYANWIRGRYELSEYDRAFLGALAELASLALSTAPERRSLHVTQSASR